MSNYSMLWLEIILNVSSLATVYRSIFPLSQFYVLERDLEQLIQEMPLILVNGRRSVKLLLPLNALAYLLVWEASERFRLAVYAAMR